MCEVEKREKDTRLLKRVKIIFLFLGGAFLFISLMGVSNGIKYLIRYFSYGKGELDWSEVEWLMEFLSFSVCGIAYIIQIIRTQPKNNETRKAFTLRLVLILGFYIGIVVALQYWIWEIDCIVLLSSIIKYNGSMRNERMYREISYGISYMFSALTALAFSFDIKSILNSYKNVPANENGNILAMLRSKKYIFLATFAAAALFFMAVPFTYDGVRYAIGFEIAGCIALIISIVFRRREKKHIR